MSASVSLCILSDTPVAECFAHRAQTTRLDRVKGELTGWQAAAFVDLALLMPLSVFLLLIPELGISASEPIIRYVRIHLMAVQVTHVLFIGKACVGGDGDLVASFVDVLTNAQSSIAFVDGIEDRS